MREPYPSPSRDRIAERLAGHPPGTANGDDLLGDVVFRKPEPAPADPLASFAEHLRARMRALGWTPADLKDRAGVTQVTITRAVNGSGVGLDLAGRLAVLVGLDLPSMLGPYACSTCHGEPPAGFGCLECGTERRG